MATLRASIEGSFHVGLSMDPRPTQYSESFPDEWFPFINSLHPQVYWGAFGVSPDVALQESYSTWRNYGRPIIPALQGYSIDRASMDPARNLAISNYGALGVSWYTLGGIGVAQFPAVNVPVSGATAPAPTPPPPVSGGSYGRQIIVS